MPKERASVAVHFHSKGAWAYRFHMADEATPSLSTAAGVSLPCPVACEVTAGVDGFAGPAAGVHSMPLLGHEAAGKAVPPRQIHRQSGNAWPRPAQWKNRKELMHMHSLEI